MSSAKQLPDKQGVGVGWEGADQLRGVLSPTEGTGIDLAEAARAAVPTHD